MSAAAVALITVFAVSTPSYEKDIQPLFREKCAYCHMSMGGRNWMIYDNAYTYRNQIRFRIWITRDMPMGGFLTEEQRALVRDWVDSGANK